MRRSSSCARRRLLARAAFTLAALHAAPAAAQARFELPDLTVHLERYTTIDDCLAAVARVRDSVESHAAVWRDSMPQGPEEMHEPLAAPVVDAAHRCGMHFAPATTPAGEYAATLQLFLLSGRDADARALIARRLAAIKPGASRERAAVLDTAFMEYVGQQVVHGPTVASWLRTQPVRIGAADSVLSALDSTFAQIKDDTLWRHRIAAYNVFMRAARDAGDTARAIAAAKHVVSFARTVAAEARLKKDVRAAMSSTTGALELLAWPELLDSLRHSTTGYAMRLHADWAKATGERPESYTRWRPSGATATPIEATYWFGRGDTTQARPTRGTVALVVFLKQDDCVDGNCFPEYARLHRLAQRFPELEITLVARTQGHLSNMAPPTPAEEADSLSRFWLGERHLPGALAVHATSFWRLPVPDRRRIDRDDPNVTHYKFELAFPGSGSGQAYLVDRTGLVVDATSLGAGGNEPRLVQLIQAVLAQPASPRTATR